MRLTRAAFEALVEKALADVPSPFREALVNVEIDVKARPGKEAGTLAGPRLLGLYSGPPRGDLTSPFASGLPPGRIVLYQRNLETHAQDESALRESIARTLRHEIGHYLGLGESALRKAGH